MLCRWCRQSDREDLVQLLLPHNPQHGIVLALCRGAWAARPRRRDRCAVRVVQAKILLGLAQVLQMCQQTLRISAPLPFRCLVARLGRRAAAA